MFYEVENRSVSISEALKRIQKIITYKNGDKVERQITGFKVCSHDRVINLSVLKSCLTKCSNPLGALHFYAIFSSRHVKTKNC